MLIDRLELMHRLTAGARAKMAEDRRRLEQLEAQSAEARGGAGASASGW